MNLRESRIKRLLADHFTREEAEQLSNYPLNDPRVIAARSERKDIYWQYKQQGLTKKDITKQVRFTNKAEGYTGKKGIEKKLEDVKTSPNTKTIYAEAKERFDRDVEARGRYRTLRQAGFFPFEAAELARMKNIPKDQRNIVFRTKPWQQMVANHKTDLKNMLVDAIKRVKKDYATKKLTDKQIELLAIKLLKNMILDHKNKRTFNPYDWLKREYRPKGIVKNYSDFKKADKSEDRFKDLKQSTRNAKFRQVKGSLWD